MKPLTPRMESALRAAVRRPNGATSNGSTIDALIRRGLITATTRSFGQRVMCPTAEGRAYIAEIDQA